MPIVARHHSLRDRVVAAVDKAFAETLRLSPMAEGRADQTRPQHEFEGVLRAQTGDAGTVKGGNGKMWNSRIAAGAAILAIDPRTYAGPQIKEGDRIRAVSLPNEPLFEVARVDDRDGNRHIVELNEV